MNYRIEATSVFEKRVKKLLKRYRSLVDDIDKLVISLQNNPVQGVDLGRGLRKVRMSIESKKKGKSGGARVIYVVAIEESDGIIRLLTIYDKSDQENISDDELRTLLEMYGKGL